MELCQSRRGIHKGMTLLDADRYEIHYELPLNEIIYDFFDALKSRTKGYASLDYELLGYRESKLVKLDILLNGEPVDALSFIVHADNAYPRARRIVEKLKDNIDRQMFEIPVQAAIGGKIIAREASYQSAPQGRSGQVLRRRYHTEEEAAGKAERGQKEDAQHRQRQSDA